MIINNGFLLLLFFLVTTVSSFNVFNNMEERSSKEIYDVESNKKYQQYLADFGYLKSSYLQDSENSEDKNESENAGENSIENALKRFQESSGLEKTGKFDKETKDKMSLPRCGVIDMKAVRITNDVPWRNKEITYSHFLVQKYRFLEKTLKRW